MAEDLEVDVLLHARTREQRSHPELQGKIERKLSELENFVDTDSERAALDDVVRAVESYLRATDASDPSDRELDLVVAALERLVGVNVAQAADADAKHQRWTGVAGNVGIAVAVVLLISITSTLFWLHRSAFRQVFDIAVAIERYGEGVRSTRLREHGPLELHSMAQQFNRMADDLDRHHEAEIVSLAGVAHDLRNPLAAIWLSRGSPFLTKHRTADWRRRSGWCAGKSTSSTEWRAT